MVCRQKRTVSTHSTSALPSSCQWIVLFIMVKIQQQYLIFANDTPYIFLRSAFWSHPKAPDTYKSVIPSVRGRTLVWGMSGSISIWRRHRWALGHHWHPALNNSCAPESQETTDNSELYRNLRCLNSWHPWHCLPLEAIWISPNTSSLWKEDQNLN